MLISQARMIWKTQCLGTINSVTDFSWTSQIIFNYDNYPSLGINHWCRRGSCQVLWSSFKMKSTGHANCAAYDWRLPKLKKIIVDYIGYVISFCQSNDFFVANSLQTARTLPLYMDITRWSKTNQIGTRQKSSGTKQTWPETAE